MYIFILEDGQTMRSKTFTDEDSISCDSGILEVIDISDPENPKTYYEGEWTLLMESV